MKEEIYVKEIKVFGTPVGNLWEVKEKSYGETYRCSYLGNTLMMVKNDKEVKAPKRFEKVILKYEKERSKK